MSFNRQSFDSIVLSASSLLLLRLNIAAKTLLANCIDSQNPDSAKIMNHMISYFNYYITYLNDRILVLDNRDLIPLFLQDDILIDLELLENYFDYSMFDLNMKARSLLYYSDFYTKINNEAVLQANKIIREELYDEGLANLNVG